MRRRLLLGGALVMILGCDTSFNPKGPYQEQMVVYAVLSPDSDTTYARVYRTYDPPGFDPYETTLEHPVTDAVVRLTSDGSSWTFGSTLVAREDTSRYKSPISAYLLPGVSVLRGARYRLDVQSPTAGSIDATVSVPGSGTILVGNSYVLQDPTLTTDNVSVRITLSSTTWGFYLRLYLIGEVWEGGAWRQFKREVPLTVIEVIDCENFAGDFPRLERRESSSTAEEHILIFENIAYRYTIASLRSGHDADSVRFIRAEFDFLETDPHLYSYYNIASGFRDEFTLRSDEPDYSNLRGGRGVFGAFALQHVPYAVPPDLGSTLTCD